MEKCILHMDGDAFFVACEIAKDPSLRGLPVVTGEERGIVSALSYEAKALGIVRGMPIFKLKKEFPQVRVLPGDYKSYAGYSSMMFDIVRRYADDVEEYSIDECFADLTGLEPPLKMSYKQIAERIKEEISHELDLSVSIGLAPTKALAKLASKWVKPNGLTIITLDTYKNFLDTTPIEKVWGIGRRTSLFLQMQGVKTAGDFARKERAWIARTMSKPYEIIWLELHGVSVLRLNPESKTAYSSVQKTRTFHPATNDRAFLISQLSKHLEDACRKARHYALVPKKLSFFLKTQTFHYASYAISLPVVSNAPEILLPHILTSFQKVYSHGVLYRTAGVGLHELIPENIRQADLFGDMHEADKFDLIYKQIDSLEEKFGKRLVYLASTHKALGQKTRGTDLDDPDRNLLFL